MAAGLPVTAGGCIDRDAVSNQPTVTTLFTANATSQAIDKVDLLFVIDNSASMGDKQTYLASAVPDLLTRLITPNCVDASGNVLGPSANGDCAQGQIEFPPVHDMHVGVITTSLGSRLGDQAIGKIPGATVCDPSATIGPLTDGTTISAHMDDHGELINRGGSDETPIPDLGTSFYLNWFPNVPANVGRQPSAGAPPIGNVAQLTQDFTSLVQGVGTFGCGIESQLESWYRFLVQPDPYASLTLDSQGRAQWSDVDKTILKQRHDFLRPDSLVAIIDLTDENDSEIDVRSYNGSGYAMMNGLWQPSRGTSACAENAAGSGLVDPQTCATCQPGSTDPSCALGPWSQWNDWGYNPNLRHVHMEQKYGVWPQFPIERYVLGLTSTNVPDRTGEYPSPGSAYQGLTQAGLDCVNPLFAASLPDGSSTDAKTLCNLTPGPRAGNPNMVYFAHIGGVPHQLLQQDPTNPDNSPQKDTLGASDWVSILGNDPEHEDYTGADPHMIESYEARPRLASPTSAPAGAMLPGQNPDPISGREWITDHGAGSDDSTIGHVLKVDREYACIFALPNQATRDCTNPTHDPYVGSGCDCPDGPTTLTYQELPPICEPGTPSTQWGAKAYPTVRELLLAKMLGNQGIVSSICPIHVDKTSDSDPLYGYRPAMNAIANRLGLQLHAECTAQKLIRDTCGRAECQILATLAAGTESDCNKQPGMSVPQADVLATYQQQQHQTWVSGGGTGKDPSTLPICEVNQLAPLPADAGVSTCGPGAAASDFDSQGSCLDSKVPGWCYVTNVTGCPQGRQQEIVFSRGVLPSGSSVNLECFEQAPTVVGGGDQ